jgi:uncharacterized small protein (DUF1192 family)
MSDVPFYRTQMGHRFYEHTVPELSRNIARLADLLERLIAVRERDGGARTAGVASPKEPTP